MQGAVTTALRPEALIFDMDGLMVDSEPVRHSVCMYSMSLDGHFILDRHPEHENVIIAAGFSGHGFKFTSCLGRAIADLVIEGSTSSPIAFLGLDRRALNEG